MKTPSETPQTDIGLMKFQFTDSITGEPDWIKLAGLFDRFTHLERDRARLMESVKYCELSTRADGQWADQAVNSFLLAALKELTC